MAHFISPWHTTNDYNTYNQSVETYFFSYTPCLREHCPEYNAVIDTMFYLNGLKKEVTAYPITGLLVHPRLQFDIHRMNPIDWAPARKCWYENGNIMSEEWWYAGERHRVYGPAVQQWSEDGLPIIELWYHGGKLHRINAPAERRWFTNGELADEQYYIYGHDIFSVKFMTLAEKMGIVDRFNLTKVEENVLMLALKK